MQKINVLRYDYALFVPSEQQLGIIENSFNSDTSISSNMEGGGGRVKYLICHILGILYKLFLLYKK
jgi:hypothetical protein